MIHRVLRLLGFGLLCGVFALGIARGQGDGFEVSFEEGVVSVQTVDAARSGLAERVSAVRGVLEAVAGAGGTERERLERLLAGLKETDLLWQQVLGAAQRLEGLQQELAGLEQVGRTTLGDVSDAGVGGVGGWGDWGGATRFLSLIG